MATLSNNLITIWNKLKSVQTAVDTIQSAMGSAGVFHYMGAVANVTALPTQNAAVA